MPREGEVDRSGRARLRDLTRFGQATGSIEVPQRSIVRPTTGSRTEAAPSRWAIFGLVSVGTFMTTLDASIVNIALPSIARWFDTPVSGLVEWDVSAAIQKLGAHNRAEAVRIAQEKGWLEPGS